MNQKVTVIGAGRMGSALAAALFKKGFTTTVWNRTASKTAPLSRLGLRVVQSLLEAVNEADVIIVNINDCNSTLQLLQHPDIESALRGKILVQLTSGTPREAREMESWAHRCGIWYLDGAIWCAPMAIRPTSPIYMRFLKRGRKDAAEWKPNEPDWVTIVFGGSQVYVVGRPRLKRKSLFRKGKPSLAGARSGSVRHRRSERTCNDRTARDRGCGCRRDVQSIAAGSQHGNPGEIT